MTDYSNKEENYGHFRKMLLQDLNPMNFAVLCGSIHRGQLEDEVNKLKTDIMNLKLPNAKKTDFVNFIERAVKAILSDNLDGILPKEQKAILHARSVIMP